MQQVDRFGGDSIMVWAKIHRGGRTCDKSTDLVVTVFGGDSIMEWAKIHRGGRTCGKSTDLVVTVSWSGQRSTVVVGHATSRPIWW